MLIITIILYHIISYYSIFTLLHYVQYHQHYLLKNQPAAALQVARSKTAELRPPSKSLVSEKRGQLRLLVDAEHVVATKTQVKQLQEEVSVAQMLGEVLVPGRNGNGRAWPF